jgi:hypothetical protein
MKISNKTKQQKIGEEEEEINKVYAVMCGEVRRGAIVGRASQ